MAGKPNSAKVDAARNKANLQKKQAQAHAQAQKIKHMMSRPKPRISES